MSTAHFGICSSLLYRLPRSVFVGSPSVQLCLKGTARTVIPFCNDTGVQSLTVVSRNRELDCTMSIVLVACELIQFILTILPDAGDFIDVAC